MSDTMMWMVVAVVAELVLLLLALLSVAWLRNRKARRRDAKAVQVLVERVRQGASGRKTALQDFLARNYGLQGEPLEAASTAFWRAEATVLQQFAGIYRDRDAAAAAQFDIRLTAAVAPYHELQGEGDAGAGAPVADGEAVDPGEVDRLREENKRLSDELKITMETMSRMLNEYSTMFSGAQSGESAPVAGATHGTAPAPPDTDPVGGIDEEVSAEEADVEPAVDAIPDATPTPAPVAESTDDDSDVEVTVDDAAAPDFDTRLPDELLGEASGDGAPPAPDDVEKGADLEAVSELLIAGSAERVTAEGGAVPPAPEVPEADAPTGLFDSVQDDGADDAIDQDDIDGLFDVVEGLAPDDASGGVSQDAASPDSDERAGAESPDSDQEVSLRREG